MTRDVSVAIAVLAVLLLAHLLVDAQDQEPAEGASSGEMALSAEGAAFTEPAPTDNPAAQKRRT